jgi:hypothetical protein
MRKGSEDLISEKEIGKELIYYTTILINKKLTKQNDQEKDWALGVVTGLMISLGKYNDFIDSKNWLRFINEVIAEISNYKKV